MQFIPVLLVLCLALNIGSTMDLPSYIKPCSKSAPDFENCCLQSGRAAIPSFLKGDKDYDIPNLTPLVLPKMTIDAGIGLKIAVSDMQVYGFEGTDLKQVKLDPKTRKALIKLDIPRLEIIGKYVVDGKVLMLPIKGDGAVNVTVVGGKYQYAFDFNLEEIAGEEYAVINPKDKLDFKVERAHFKLDNLFGGDQRLGDQMNNFLNKNWKQVVSTLSGAISDTVGSLVRSLTAGIAKKVPFKKILLE
ncbi:hypothetical protein JTB14_020669 [Gonioctena quinquepunctata]|nr:hypothetical protein JTB14_020669 [Gonioctena quinquepunctata]